MDGIYRYWSGALMSAVRSDEHTVELVEGPNGGAQVEIDDVPMFDGSGYPCEQFNLAAGGDYQQYITDDGIQKLREMYPDSDRTDQ